MELREFCRQQWLFRNDISPLSLPFYYSYCRRSFHVNIKQMLPLLDYGWLLRNWITFPWILFSRLQPTDLQCLEPKSSFHFSLLFPLPPHPNKWRTPPFFSISTPLNPTLSMCSRSHTLPYVITILGNIVGDHEVTAEGNSPILRFLLVLSRGWRGILI